MADAFPTKVPHGFIYRIARGPDPFEPPPWSAAPDGKNFRGHYDDPSGYWGYPPDKRYRIVSCASLPVGAYGEKLSRLPRPGEIPRDWGHNYLRGTTRLVDPLPFVDMDDPETIRLLGLVAELVEAVNQLSEGLRRFVEDEIRRGNPAPPLIGEMAIEHSLVAGPFRDPTQRIARYLYNRYDGSGNPLYGGVRYSSRHDRDWECWGIFVSDGRPMRHNPELPLPVTMIDRDLAQAAWQLNLTLP